MVDFLIVMGAVMFVCFSGGAYALWWLRTRDTKPRTRATRSVGAETHL